MPVLRFDAVMIEWYVLVCFGFFFLGQNILVVYGRGRTNSTTYDKIRWYEHEFTRITKFMRLCIPRL